MALYPPLLHPWRPQLVSAHGLERTSCTCANAPSPSMRTTRRRRPLTRTAAPQQPPHRPDTTCHNAAQQPANQLRQARTHRGWCGDTGGGSDGCAATIPGTDNAAAAHRAHACHRAAGVTATTASPAAEREDSATRAHQARLIPHRPCASAMRRKRCHGCVRVATVCTASPTEHGCYHTPRVSQKAPARGTAPTMPRRCSAVFQSTCDTSLSMTSRRILSCASLNQQKSFGAHARSPWPRAAHTCAVGRLCGGHGHVRAANTIPSLW